MVSLLTAIPCSYSYHAEISYLMPSRSVGFNCKHFLANTENWESWSPHFYTIFISLFQSLAILAEGWCIFLKNPNLLEDISLKKIAVRFYLEALWERLPSSNPVHPACLAGLKKGRIMKAQFPEYWQNQQIPDFDISTGWLNNIVLLQSFSPMILYVREQNIAISTNTWYYDKNFTLIACRTGILFS